MRIVVDTNVIASAIYFGGKPFELLKLTTKERISAIAGKEIVEEYEEVLTRLQLKFPKLSKQLPFYEIIRKLSVINDSSDIHISEIQMTTNLYPALLTGNAYTSLVETMACQL
ncbi:MAG: putative toxin-antitoxin system toxin component, PIN family [Bacteroides sp. CAG:1060_57_27]|nr:MAG: putative toxin-antitoxin system toxin component, PIN family [Bacteroides sp. CAG:1060_57_27]